MKKLKLTSCLIIFVFFPTFFFHIAIAQDLEPASSILEKINTYNNSLDSEITKIPGYHNSLNDKQLIALSRFGSIVKNISPQQERTIKSFLQVGIPTKRKYCTPLQAVLWVLEREYDTAVLGYSLEQLLNKAWIFTEADRWSDFDAVTDRLNAPELINYYQRRQFIYDSRKGTKKAKKADIKRVFKTNVGSCVDAAAFTVYCMEKGGYDASFVNVHPSPRGYHSVCRYTVDGTKYILDNGRPDKFFRRGIVLADKYEMYHDKLY